MILDKLGRLCLQQLEQDPDIDVTSEEYTMEELSTNDTYAEYVNNIYHSIFSALVRFANNKILPIKEAQFPKGKSVLELNNDNGIRDFHEIKEVYATKDDNFVDERVSYIVIGSKIRIKNFNNNYDYWCVYYPTIHDLATYQKRNESIWDVDLEKMGIPDEMAIMVKYYVYADLKYEENASTATNFRNVFENYIADMKTIQVANVDVEYKSSNMFEKGNSIDEYTDFSFMDGDING